MENFDANAGTNKLANVLSDRMRRENDTSLCLDFGEIQGNGSLITNTFPVAIQAAMVHMVTQLRLHR